ncbi:hypothetical protein CASFOL_040721 [Castilleja foliolosa]|uniref:Exocyst subunit Exo70 family protein n=1 Tax=Castilleja foliolosa TaxID=1961234 RepID=A0ABD3BCF8_9LAMI
MRQFLNLAGEETEIADVARFASDCDHVSKSESDEEHAEQKQPHQKTAVQLFNFAEAISISRRSPEKLFKILDLHDALSDLLPDIESVFDSKLSESIEVEAVEIISRLAEAARGVLSEFENAILREPSKIPVPGGLVAVGVGLAALWMVAVGAGLSGVGRRIAAGRRSGFLQSDDDDDVDGELVLMMTWMLRWIHATSKKVITRVDWEKKLNDVKVRKEDMNKLVMNYLVTEGYVEAAEKFRLESGTEQNSRYRSCDHF